MRGRDPLDLGVEDLSNLVEAALEVADVDALEGGEQPAHGLEVLLRHRRLSISRGRRGGGSSAVSHAVVLARGGERRFSS